MAYSIEELQSIYLTTAASKAQSADIDITNLSDFQAKGFATASVGASVSSDAQRLFQEALPQYSTSLGANSQLAARGAQPQLPSSPAILTLSANDVVAGKTYLIPLGTYLTSADKKVYQVTSPNPNETNVVVTSTANVIYAQSSTNGGNTSLNIGSVLTLSPPIVSTDGTVNITQCTVTQSVNGTNEESLSSAISRLIEIYQSPLDLTRGTDYKNQAIAINGGIVRDAAVLTNNQITYSSSLYNCGVFLAVNDPINNAILNQGLTTPTAVVYSRVADSGTITTTQQYFTAQYIVGSRPNVRTLSTQALTANTDTANPFIKCVVVLQNGYTLSSDVTIDGNVFTIQQLIQREIRRAICAQPFGATLEISVNTGEISSSKILVSAIQNQLDVTLGTSNTTGTLGAYLVDRTIFIKDSGGNYVQNASIPLSVGIPSNPANNLPWVYDISLTPSLIYPNIGVTL